MEPFVKSPLPLFSKEGDLVFHFAEVGRGFLPFGVGGRG